MLRATLDPQTKRIVYKDDGITGASAPSLPMAPNAAPGEISLPQLSVGPGDTAAPSSAPSMSMSGGMAPPNMLGSHLSGLERQYGLPQGYLAQIRAIESSNGQNLANPNSSARGPYQIIDKTRDALGLSDADRMDEYKSSAAIAKMAAGDSAAFQAKFGSAPTGSQLYGMHQQGRTGYFGLLNGQTPGEAAQALNGAKGQSAQGQLNVIDRMYQNAKPDLPGDPTTRYGSGFGTSSTAPTTPAGGDAGGGTPTPAPQTNNSTPGNDKFNGGILGLLKGDDYTGAGANKDFMGKMADFTGSSAFTSGMKGLMGLMGGGGGGQQTWAPGIQNLPAEDQENKPQMSLLQMLYGKGGVQSGGVLGR